MPAHYSRRTLLAVAAFASAFALATPSAALAAGDPPILFVHGADDSAVQFYTVAWRFESNGYDPKRLFALNFTNPAPLFDNDKPTPNRSSAEQQRNELAARVAEVLQQSGEDKIVLVAHSRGGLAVRNYIKTAGGAAHVSMAILCATPNHGSRAADADPINSEFHPAGAFLRQLNDGATEATPAVRFLTLRSDSNDIVFQPTRIRWGHPEQPSNLQYHSPELTGATNLVLPGRSHTEVLTDPQAFKEMYRFITGREPARLDIVTEPSPTLDGMVTSLAGDVPTNLPLQGTTVEIFEVSSTTGERVGPAVHRKTTGADGYWGPFRAKSGAYYEFVVAPAQYAVTHIYWTPFPRSSKLLHLRPARLSEKSKAAASVIVLYRPNGDLGRGHVKALIDGATAPGLEDGPPQEQYSVLRLMSDAPRSVPVVLNDERLTTRTWPTRDNHLVIARFHY